MLSFSFLLISVVLHGFSIWGPAGMGGDMREGCANNCKLYVPTVFLCMQLLLMKENINSYMYIYIYMGMYVYIIIKFISTLVKGQKIG